MAIVIGRGISIGGGIGVGTGAPTGGGGGGGGDNFVVATVNTGGYDYYGAYNYTNGSTNLGISDFGTITSNYLYGIFYQTDGFSFSTSILLNNGTYSGFTVTNGQIDSDPVSYPRVFTIGGVDYIFYYNGNGFYSRYDSDPLGLVAAVGSTVSAVYNPAVQLTIPAGSILVGTYTSAGTTYYGVNNTFAGYGYSNTSHIQSIDYYSLFGSYTNIIQLVPGTYTGFVVDSDGAVDSSSASKVFTVGGTNVTFGRAGSAPNYTYQNTTQDPLGLVANVGQVVTAIYDPAKQSAPPPAGEFATGTITVGYDGFATYGWNPPSVGSSTFNFISDAVGVIKYDTAGSGATYIYLQAGTYNSVVIDTTAGTVDGETTITATIDGVSATLTISGGVASVVSDPFSLQSKNGQTLTVTMVAGTVVAADLTGNITVGFNNIFGDRYGYQAVFPGPYGSVSVVPDAIAQLYNTSTFTAVRFNGTSVGGVSTDSMTGLADGITSLSVTIDGATTTVSTGGPAAGGYSVAGDPLSLATKDGQTLSLAITLL
jgi:hypothetical protein